MSASTEANAEATAKAAEQLLQNAQFLELFQRALANGNGDNNNNKGDGTAASLLQDMPPEGDPRRDAWLRTLQARLQAEAAKETTQQLEQVQSDEHGQWMYILPTPGFCIKCTVAGGGKVFVNVCQHERIGEPTPLSSAEPTTSSSNDKNNNSNNNNNKSSSSDDDSSEVRFRIPISCGHPRPDTDKSGRPCKVYDVVVNPSTVARCAHDRAFRRFVAALCMQWIQQKSEPTLNVDAFRNVNFKVKGTLEPQRIRLSHTPKTANALRDEIALPPPRDAATVPRHVGGTRGTGQLIEELDTTTRTRSSSSSDDKNNDKNNNNNNNNKKNSNNNNNNNSNNNNDNNNNENTHAQPCVVHVTPEGAYDWSRHAKPMANVYFRDTAVPAAYRVELHLPHVHAARDVDVRVCARRLECYTAVTAAANKMTDKPSGDNNNNNNNDSDATRAEATPCLTVTFDYPVSDEVREARFVKKTSRLRLRCVVQLPDETAAPATRPSRDADAEEREAEQQAAAAREAAAAAAHAARERAAAEEARVMQARKALVANVAALQSGTLPPAVRDEVDGMPKTQLPALLQRLEGRVRRGDAVDALLDKLPEAALDELCAHVREKLSLQPRPSSTARAAHVRCANDDGSPDNAAAATATATTANNNDNDNDAHGTSELREYNFAKKSERLFGVEFRNRYLFALDQ